VFFLELILMIYFHVPLIKVDIKFPKFVEINICE